MSCVAPCLRSSRCSGSTLAGAADSSALLRSKRGRDRGGGLGVEIRIGMGMEIGRGFRRKEMR